MVPRQGGIAARPGRRRNRMDRYVDRHRRSQACRRTPRAGRPPLGERPRHRTPIHLLITDVVMPGIPGCMVAEQIRDLHPETKVLYVWG